ncbi:MAG: DNA-packaging protein [Bacteroidales bacterium]|nr:DNA-packaging protein [Bacteroidales bacterium]
MEIKNDLLRVMLSRLGVGEDDLEIKEKPANPRHRPCRYPTHLHFLRVFAEYVEFTDEHPRSSRRSTKKQQAAGENGKKMAMDAVEQERNSPYSLEGFCAFAVIGDWRAFKATNNASQKTYSDSIRACEAFILKDQIEGAMLGEYNANIVSRLNGLSEHVKADVSTRGSRDDLILEYV